MEHPTLLPSLTAFLMIHQHALSLRSWYTEASYPSALQTHGWSCLSLSIFRQFVKSCHKGKAEIKNKYKKFTFYAHTLKNVTIFAE